MTWLELAAVAYLVVGLAMGAMVWAVALGDTHRCDECDPDGEHQFMVEMIGFGLREPATRWRIATALTVLIAVVVVAWPAVLALSVAMRAKEGRQ